MGISSVIHTLSIGERVALFIIDATRLGGTTLRLHGHKTVNGASLTFDGDVYTAFPITAAGFEKTGRGTLPTPKLQCANLGGVLTALLRTTGDLAGARLTRIVTLSQYLDGAADADPTQILSTDVWVIDRKSYEDKERVEFELRSTLDVEGKLLPGRQVIASNCPAQVIFRGPDCGYTSIPLLTPDGAAVTALADRAAWSVATAYSVGDYAYELVSGVRVYYVALTAQTGAALTDTAAWIRTGCPKRLETGCKVHFPPPLSLPYGGFPGAASLPRV